MVKWLHAAGKSHLFCFDWVRTAFEAFLCAGCDINTTDGFSTPMHWAASRGDLEVLKWLHGAGRSRWLWLWLWLSWREWLSTVWVEFLCAGGDPDARTQNNGDSPMHWAARHGRLDAMKWLHEVGKSFSFLCLCFTCLYGVWGLRLCSLCDFCGAVSFFLRRFVSRSNLRVPAAFDEAVCLCLCLSFVKSSTVFTVAPFSQQVRMSPPRPEMVTPPCTSLPAWTIWRR